MTSSEDILAQIDNAIEDWTVSDDAVRSRPGREPEPVGFRGTTPTLYIADEAGEWRRVEGVAAVEICFDVPTVDPELMDAWARLAGRIRQADLERARHVQAELEALAGACVEAVKPAVEAAGRALAEISRSLQQAGPENLRHLPEAEGCNDCTPAPRRDRPAWQSPYGPARHRRP